MESYFDRIKTDAKYFRNFLVFEFLQVTKYDYRTIVCRQTINKTANTCIHFLTNKLLIRQGSFPACPYIFIFNCQFIFAN